jgi:hypothetical protein
MREKAEYFDRLARVLHVHPAHNIINSVRLKPGVAEKNAAYGDVATWHTGENDGLWGSSYIAAQAFRYAVTGEEEALENLRTTTRGMKRQFEITGVPGLVTREYITPGIAGMECPQDPAEYIPDADKTNNRWLKVDAEGCVNTYDGSRWVATTHCVDRKFAGYCWLDNVSQDEYSGHMLAMGVIGRLVDDPEVRGIAVELSGATVRHLIDHRMQFVDWDGRVTEHGRVHPLSLSDYPGFVASLALSWVRVGSSLSGDAALSDFYDGCLLKKKRMKDCPEYPGEEGVSYLDFLKDHVLYRSADGCVNNYNNFNMIFMAIFNLLWYENRPEVRQKVQDIYEDTMMQAGEGQKRQMIGQGNAFFNFAFAAMKRLGPGSTGPAYQAVEDGICTLREFPASKARAARDSTGHPFDCTGRLGGSLTSDPVPIYERCPGIFVWTADPYEMKKCSEDLRSVIAPVDFLLAYWMGRYFGFIPADL